MFNSMHNHLVYTRAIDIYALIDDMLGLGGSEHVALFADDQVALDETFVEGQRMPIIVKNVPNSAPMGNTVMPLHGYFDIHGPEQHDLSGLSILPPSNIDYTDTLFNIVLNSFMPYWPNQGLRSVYFFPDNHTILYVFFGVNAETNSSHITNITIKLAVATQNAMTGEIIDQQLFEPSPLTNIVIDLASTPFYNGHYGFKILNTNYYCVFSKYTWGGDMRTYPFIIIKSDHMNVGDKSWPVLRDPQLFVKSHVQNNFKNWIAHIVANNQTYVCVENQNDPSIDHFGSSILAIDGSTNTISKYICNYAYNYGSYT